VTEENANMTSWRIVALILGVFLLGVCAFSAIQS
jgi:hypothetical protein